MDIQTILSIVIPIVTANGAVIGVVYRFSKDVRQVCERLAKIEGRLGIDNPGSKEKKDA
jgi:hypothetical protein